MSWKWKILITVFLILTLITVFVQKTLTPIFISIAKSEAVRLANKAINEAVDEESTKLDYNDLVNYIENNKGDIILVQPNTKHINNFSSRISLKIQEKLLMVDSISVPIPMASVLGVDLLAGMGPTVDVKIIPIGFTEPPEIMDSFVSAGINQTRHKIYLHVMTRLKLIVPFQSRVIDVQAQVPVTEVTILGKVPQVYVGIEGKELPGIISRSLEDDKK